MPDWTAAFDWPPGAHVCLTWLEGVNKTLTCAVITPDFHKTKEKRWQKEKKKKKLISNKQKILYRERHKRWTHLSICLPVSNFERSSSVRIQNTYFTYMLTLFYVIITLQAMFRSNNAYTNSDSKWIFTKASDIRIEHTFPSRTIWQIVNCSENIDL